MKQNYVNSKKEVLMKRILSILGIILLLGMYAATLVFAVIDSPNAAGWFKASIYCTIVVPVLLYGYMLIYRHLKNKNNKTGTIDSKTEESAKQEEL